MLNNYLRLNYRELEFLLLLGGSIFQNMNICQVSQFYWPHRFVYDFINVLHTYFSLDKNIKHTINVVIDRIINEYGIERENIYMIGDSIEKDILMAKNANIKDIWAEYGTKYQRGYGSVLRSITPWSRTKQKKEGVFQRKIESTYIISDFAEIKDIIS